MQEQIEKDKTSSKTWDNKMVIELPKDEISWALQVYGLSSMVPKYELKKLFNCAINKHHSDAGDKH